MSKSLQSLERKRKYYENNRQLVWDVLNKGSQEARKVTQTTLVEVKKAMRIDYVQ